MPRAPLLALLMFSPLLLSSWSAARADRPVLEPVRFATAPGPQGLIAAPRYRDDAVIVRVAAGTPRALAPGGRLESLGIPSLDRLAAELGVSWEPEFPGDEGAFAEFWIAHLPPGTDVVAAVARFATLSEVRTAHRIALVPALATPNDSLWSNAYYFHQASRRDMHAPEAWDVTVGDTSIVVAIIDTGMLPTHPDLAGQFWTNWAERSGAAGVDDDLNGYVDDDHGWDFVDLGPTVDVRPGEDRRDPDNDPNDFAGHGTAVGGLVGARTNNVIGVAGTAWKVRLMPLRIGWSSVAHPSGEGDVSYIARAFRYATRMGAQIINCSFTTTDAMDLIEAVDAASAAGITVVTASGNFFASHYIAQREDVIAVTGSDETDRLLGYATQGPNVDIAAAGYRLTSTVLDRDTLGNRWPDYTTGASGTSFSSPLAAGAVALLQAQRLARGEPLLTPFEARLRLMDTADDIAGFGNHGSGGYGTGRLNLLRALTDPPGSRVAASRAEFVGPGVVVPTRGGKPLVVVPTAGRLFLLDGATGTDIGSVVLPGRPVGGIAAAHLGAGSQVGLFIATPGLINGYDADLEPLPGWPVSAPVVQGTKASEPVLADLDGDGALEVLWSGSVDGRIRAWRSNGQPFGNPISMIGANVGSVEVMIAVSDLDTIPGVEIVAATNARVRVFRGDGSALPGWPTNVPGSHPLSAGGRSGSATRTRP